MPPTRHSFTIGACCAAIGTLVPIALYQGHVIDELPDPPGSVFASKKIVSSRSAHPFGIPDSYLGLGSYATTLTLLLLAPRSPAARLLAGAKLALDGTAASVNAVRQVVGFGRLCSWCTGTALATAVMVVGGRRMVAEAAEKAGRLL